MKKALTSIVEFVLIMGIILGFLLAACENEDGSCNIVWSLSWLAEMVVSGFLYTRFFIKKVNHSK